MVFMKHFDTSKQTLTGAGKTYMLRTSKVGDLVTIINERMRWPAGTPVKLYEVLPLFVAYPNAIAYNLFRKSNQE